ncbi:MAG TPA: type VI secretion system baseplate subunit TssG [Gemmatimonadaceae bacterium]|nr:type VI secretion system baseplate subunit TssG [Gemmatimonadaceae bacterium]
METSAVDAALREPTLATRSDPSLMGPEADARAASGESELLPGGARAYEFFQAVRALIRGAPERDPVGGYGDPANEVVRFGVDPTLGFPPTDITSFEERDGAPPRMAVAFMGLIGPSGLLPHHYTLLAGDRGRVRDHALRDFLDIVHHRLLSLFYLAWEKHRFAIAHERNPQDHLTRHLLDLIGLGTPGLRERLGIPAEALLPYAGLLSLRPRPAVALEQMLEDHFGVPVVVEQFVGGWFPLGRGTQCELGEETIGAATLGEGAVVGDEIWDQQARARIRLGPLTRAQYEDFLPTGSAYAPLRALARFFTGDEVDLEVQLVMARDEIPACVLGADEDAPPLGWCTWLRSSRPGHDSDDTILSLADARSPS